MKLFEELEQKRVDRKHIQLLYKFAALQGSVIKGEKPIRGEKGSNGCKPDIFVDGNHRLHGLVRGIYVPKHDKFALSILLTEKDTNYGKELAYFSSGNWRVSYKPPRDKLAVRDVQALRRCFDSEVPIGVLRNIKKGVNEVLGLGEIIDVRHSIFSIVPFQPRETVVAELDKLVSQHIKQQIRRKDYSAPDIETTVIARTGQKWFRQKLLQIYGGRCAFCGFNVEDFLIAAHVVPYIEDRDNRLNPQNGILLCRLCDLAFEKGYLRLQEDWCIIKSHELVRRASSNVAVSSWLSNVKQKIEPRLPDHGPKPKFLRERDKKLLKH